jgi:hypothetical protein
MKMKLTIGFLKACTAVVRIGFPGHSTLRQLSMHFNNYHNGSKERFPIWRLITVRSWLGAGIFLRQNSHHANRLVKAISGSPGRPHLKGLGVRSDDTVMLLAYFPSKKYAVDSLQGSIRKEGEAVLMVPSAFAGEEAHCYLCFANLPNLAQDPSAEYISNSMYPGVITVS